MRLKEEALKCLSTYGIKKTTVDELVKRVNIPKGTFYLFYESKELLLFDAINDLHNEIQKKLLQELQGILENLTVDQLTDFMLRLYQEVNNTGLLSVIMNGELEALMRKLPEETVKEHLAHDNFSIEQFFSFLPLKEKKNINIEAYSGAFRGIFLTMLYKREIGINIFDDAMRLMLRGLMLQIFEEEKND
ncbi:MAG: TetR family transcriptional regulator [Herbinix sp.]|nr:TetR family transcriptional regulator [Herbinix sp.]